MKRYLVNKNAQSNGDHEVHIDGCIHQPDSQNKHYLGTFFNCRDAVSHAKKLGYKRANGCKYCSKECHTS